MRKLISWSQQVDTVINIKTVGIKLVHSVTGIIETGTVVFCMGYHFMNNIIELEIKSDKDTSRQPYPKVSKTGPQNMEENSTNRLGRD